MNRNKKLILIVCFGLISIFGGCDNNKDTQSMEVTTNNIDTTITTISGTTTFEETSSIPTESEITTIITTELLPSNLIEHYSQDILPDSFKSIDWNEDMVVNSNEELIAYLDKCREELMTEIPFILSGSCDAIEEDILVGNENGILIGHCEQESLSHDDVKGIYCVYHVQYFTSEYVIRAYQTGDTSHLEGDNLEVYNRAVDFIENTLNKDASDIEKERQIHDYICSITSYNSDESQEYSVDNVPRFRMASGSILDGEANCMGYTDTFYMLGTMAGLQVGKANGDQSMNHAWNTIVLDGKKYVVDVTWDDDYLGHDGIEMNGYLYFNAGRDILSEKYRYDPNDPSMVDVVPITDEKYFFAMNSPEYGYMTHSYDEFYNKIKELIESGQTTFYIACSNNVAGDTSDLANKIKERLQRSIYFNGNLINMSGYSFSYMECKLAD
ncbi:MAG: hypothetical protein ACI4WH_01615 [Oscillospiraceae bacterium]